MHPMAKSYTSGRTLKLHQRHCSFRWHNSSQFFEGSTMKKSGKRLVGSSGATLSRAPKSQRDRRRLREVEVVEKRKRRGYSFGTSFMIPMTRICTKTRTNCAIIRSMASIGWPVLGTSARDVFWQMVRGRSFRLVGFAFLHQLRGFLTSLFLLLLFHLHRNGSR